MNDPAKKKKLDEIRRKNKELQRQLNTLKEKDSTKTSDKSVEQIAKEALESSKPTMPVMEEDIAKSKFVVELLRRKFNDSLRETNFTETFVGCRPERYDEMSQCIPGTGADDGSEDEQEAVQRIFMTRDHLLRRHVRKDGDKKENYNDNRPLTYNIISEEKRKEVADKKKEDLNEFIIKERKKMERALHQDELYELFKTIDDDDSNNLASKKDKKYMNTICEYFDDVCTKRVVVDVDWSLKYPELLLAAYSKPDDFNVTQQNGLILLWSLALRKIPEFSFCCQTEVTSAIFHTYNPKIVIGGTYTGQINLWDTRGKPNPYQKTAITVESKMNEVTSHHSPITGLGVIGSINANHLVSISSDGILCLWTLTNFSKPIKVIELKKLKSEFQNFNEIGALSLGYMRYDTNNVFIGSEDNQIYQVSLHENESKNNIASSYKGHFGPIYSIDLHPEDYYNTGNFSHLFATSSADWTTKIWSRTADAPLLTLDTSNDYVYCSKWCPTNSAVLATGDGNGLLNFWDLNKNIELPIYSHSLGEDEVINKMAWSSDGRRMAVGNNKGKVSIFGIDREIYSSNSEESIKFEKLIAKLKLNSR